MLAGISSAGHLISYAMAGIVWTLGWIAVVNRWERALAPSGPAPAVRIPEVRVDSAPDGAGTGSAPS